MRVARRGRGGRGRSWARSNGKQLYLRVCGVNGSAGGATADIGREHCARGGHRRRVRGRWEACGAGLHTVPNWDLECHIYIVTPGLSAGKYSNNTSTPGLRSLQFYLARCTPGTVRPVPANQMHSRSQCRPVPASIGPQCPSVPAGQMHSRSQCRPVPAGQMHSRSQCRPVPAGQMHSRSQCRPVPY